MCVNETLRAWETNSYINAILLESDEHRTKQILFVIPRTSINKGNNNIWMLELCMLDLGTKNSTD